MSELKYGSQVLNPVIQMTPIDDSKSTSTNVFSASKVDELINDLGYENLTPYPYHHGEYCSLNGLTFIENTDDCSITVTGTATAATDYWMCGAAMWYRFLEPGVDYYVTGCPAGGSATTYCITTRYWDDTSVVQGYNDIGNGVHFKFNGTNSDYTRNAMFIHIGNGTVMNHTFYPMLVKGTEAREYVPAKYSRVNVDNSLQYATNNLISFPYSHSSFTTNRGVAFEVQEDGGIHCYGTANSTAHSYFNIASRIKLEPGTYTLCSESTSSYVGASVYLYDDYESTVAYSGEYSGDLNTSSSSVYVCTTKDGTSFTDSNLYVANKAKTFTIKAPAYAYVQARTVCSTTTVKSVNAVVYVSFYKGSAKHKFEKSLQPNILKLNSASSEITDIKMLGWTVPTRFSVKNYIAANGYFYQNVERIDASTLNWTLSSGQTSRFVVDDLKDLIYIPDSTSYVPNVYLADTYIPTNYDSLASNPNKAIFIASDGSVIVNDSAYTTVDTFKASLQGVYLYYRIKTPKSKIAEGNEVIHGIYYGTSTPSSSLGNNGDIYFVIPN